MTNLTDATEDTFDALVTHSKGAVLVDVWAEWCGPCKAMTPALHSIAERFESNLSVIKLNMDDNEDLVDDLGVRSLPSLLLYKDGTKIATRSGAATEFDISEFVTAHLS
ncbi:thioredoxin domain-containing protein [uncultured Tateyamaria sp.]|uniref:thioredoxin family protein n=1 Tax=uncultured Tateyamaria sp. TaxID=455651 RepID=UPI00263962E8|nr:thioredoxin domain-containing protein [uncultured Tateyamaria sp.]